MESKLVALGLLLGIAAPAFAAQEPVAPETEMIQLKGGFELELAAEVEIPLSGDKSVFVVQRGKLHAGMWAWRGERFVVLKDLANPGSDIPLRSDEPTCQVHIDAAATPLQGTLSFKAMRFSGDMRARGMSLYNALSSPNERIFLNCLVPREGEASGKLLASSLLEAWGDRLEAIYARK